MKLLSPKTQESRPITDRVKESLFSVLYKYDLPDGNPAPLLVQGKIVADLFCGVGSLGLEALSRGAEFVTFVEKDPKIITILEKNIEKAGFAGESKVIRANAFKIGAPVDPVRSKTAISNGVGEQKYDLIFVDPPYADTRQASRGLTAREIKAGSPLSPVKSKMATPFRSKSPTSNGATSNRVSELLILLSEQLAPNGIVVVRTHRRTILLDQYGPEPCLVQGGQPYTRSGIGQFQVIERRQWGTMAVTILSKR